MNGGKDVKIGHDKRPISVIPKDQRPLYNIANGEILTDQDGNPLVTEVDQFFLPDASKERATSVTFPTTPQESYSRRQFSSVGISTATYGVDLDVPIGVSGITTTSLGTMTLLKVAGGGTPISVGSTVKLAVGVGSFVSIANYPNQVEVRVNSDLQKRKNLLYFPESDLTYTDNVIAGDKVLGSSVPDGSFVTRKDFDRVTISNSVTTAGIYTGAVQFIDDTPVGKVADNVLKVAEIFRETSEVSTTLLGVNRAETQLSLFSNVSSYGLNSDDWEFFSLNGGLDFSSWSTRANKIYGKRYLANIKEETQESGIRLEAFPPPYSYPFGPKFSKVGLYDSNKFNFYLDFVRLGNQLFTYYDSGLGSTQGYPSDWKDKFLNPNVVTVAAGDVIYDKNSEVGDVYGKAFAAIDTWTDTWREIKQGTSLLDPTTQEFVSFGTIGTLLGVIYTDSNTVPGYATDNKRYSFLQSRRVFRYQPGRISGFTFGLRSSVEKVSGVKLEWGIANETDQYMFKIFEGNLSIIRRSTVKLENSVLTRNGLDIDATSVNIDGTTYETIQPEIRSGDPFDGRTYWTIEIPKDKFNGDPLNGNGPSGYTIKPENVTMWKIEFGWYGAIGARFYAYIPAGNGEARWVVIHTLVIENSLDGPCLRDSYFRFKYSLDVFDNSSLFQPQFLYKYGASYYIDGGDEGTSDIFSVSTGLVTKPINRTTATPLIGIRPKDVIVNSTGNEIGNRKIIIPTKLNMSTDSLTEVKIVNCKACPGFGHVFSPGVGSTITGRDMQIEFTASNTITAVGTGASFTESDIGAKLIAPSIFNAYIVAMDGTATEYASGFKTYESAMVKGYGDNLDSYPSYGLRQIGGSDVLDYAFTDPLTGVAGSVTTVPVGIGSTYPHLVRFSNYDVHFASDFPLSGSKIEIQFLNPSAKDQSSSGGSGTHFADFLIGVTDKKPSITGQTLNGWSPQDVPWRDYENISGNYVGTGLTSVLPKSEILYGESTHSYASLNEDGIEGGEDLYASGTVPVRMGLDYRIPRVSNPSGGFCSRLNIEVLDPTIMGSNMRQIYGVSPLDENLQENPAKYYIIKEGPFPTSITDWIGGQVAYESDDGESVVASNAKFVSNPGIRTDSQGNRFGYIEIDQSIRTIPDTELIGTQISGITLYSRAVISTGGQLPTRSKLYNFNPFPLYLVGKLKDNAKIHNITVKETVGDFQRTISPILAIPNDANISIDNAGGNTGNVAIPPTNFESVERLSGATVDVQNEQALRNSVTKDTFFIGANETKVVDMKKVFGVDRNVITPDNNNIEATFVIAKKIDGDESNNTGNVQMSLNFKEQ